MKSRHHVVELAGGGFIAAVCIKRELHIGGFAVNVNGIIGERLFGSTKRFQRVRFFLSHRADKRFGE